MGICHKNHINDSYWESVTGTAAFTSISANNYNKEETPFDIFSSQIYVKYKEVNSKKLNSEALQKVKREMDLVIPSYTNNKKKVDKGVIAKAAMAGRLDFLKWAFYSFGGSVFDYEVDMEYAKRGEAVEVQQWLRNTFV